MFHLCSALLEGVEHLDLITGGASGYSPNYNGDPYQQYTHAAFGPMRTNQLLSNGSGRFNYDVDFWKRIPSSVCTVQDYIMKAIGRMVNSQELYSKGIVNLTMYQYCAESAYQTTLSNAIFCPVTTTELNKLCFASMEMSYMLLVILIQNFDNVDNTIKLNANEALKRCKNDAAATLSEYEQVNRDTMSFKPTSTLNKSSIGAVSQSVRKVDEEDHEERFYLSFIRKYFPLGA